VPVEFLTDAQAATYGCYVGAPSVAELDRCFLLDDKARGCFLLDDKARGLIESKLMTLRR
jgi:hypothetical protein